MAVQDMDICINVCSDPIPARTNKTRKNNEKKLKTPLKVEQSKDTNVVNVKKQRIKQKSLQAIVAKQLKESAATKLLNEGPVVKKTTFVRKVPGPTPKVKPSLADVFSKRKVEAEIDPSEATKKHEKPKQKKPTSSSKVSSLFGNNPQVPNIGQRLVKPVQEEIFTEITFDDLNVHPHMVANLEQNMNITKMTTIQQKSIPHIISGKDVLIRSQTGSGKTLAYALPIVELLHKIQPKLVRGDGLRALVIVPTRELALQSYECFLKLTKSFNWVVPGYLTGGEKRKAEKARLRKGCNILVSTPGRLLDHIQHTVALKLDQLEYLVLDEADRMLDMGYEKDISEIVNRLRDSKSYNPMELLKQNVKKVTPEEDDTITPRKTQTILLSATLTPAIEKLAGLAMENPIHINGSENNDANEDLIVPQSVVQNYVVTPAKLRMVTLSAYLVDKCKNSKNKKILIFMATQDMIDFHTDILSSVLTNISEEEDEDDESDPLVEIEFFKLHGSMTQHERTEVFKSFRSANSGVLLCTDVASRGLDLPKVDCVVQYTGPLSARDYVHRIGRTARAGSSGTATIFLTPSEIEFVRMLESKRIRINRTDMDDILNHLIGPLTKHNSVQGAATALQNDFENLLLQNKTLHGKAVKAYLSWIRFYSSYPKEMRDIFNRKELHLGHYAKSFALRDAPQRISGVGKSINSTNPGGSKHENRLTFQRSNDNDTAAPPRQQEVKRKVSLKNVRMLNVSEYGSGLEPFAKKLKK